VGFRIYALLRIVVGVVDGEDTDERIGDEADQDDHQQRVDDLYRANDDALPDFPVVQLAGPGCDRDQLASSRDEGGCPRIFHAGVGPFLLDPTLGTDRSILLDDRATAGAEHLIVALRGFPSARGFSRSTAVRPGLSTVPSTAGVVGLDLGVLIGANLMVMGVPATGFGLRIDLFCHAQPIHPRILISSPELRGKSCDATVNVCRRRYVRVRLK